VVRAALYDAEDEKTSAETRNGETTDAIGGFKGWSDLCPYGVLEAQSGSILAQGTASPKCHPLVSVCPRAA